VRAEGEQEGALEFASLFDVAENFIIDDIRAYTSVVNVVENAVPAFINIGSSFLVASSGVTRGITGTRGAKLIA